MTDHRPLRYRWTGEAMVPVVPAHARRQFKAGETYQLEIREERSANSHRAYFAAINEGWANMPEIEAMRFPTAEHLRKWLLIKAGYFNERQIVVASAAEAVRVAGFIKPMDDYAVVVPRGTTVSVFTAKSQSLRAMNRREFAESKTKVLDLLAEMIGVARRELDANAGRAA